MGIFATNKAFARLDDRCKALEDTCSGLTRDSKRRELEAIELYDKVRHQMSRMAKRYAVDQKENGELSADDVPDDVGPSSDPISEAILARRNRGFLNQ